LFTVSIHDFHVDFMCGHDTHTLVAISTFAAASVLGAQERPDVTPYLIADRAAEVALARTAAPSRSQKKPLFSCSRRRATLKRRAAQTGSRAS
jgi:hypothetical protein